MSVSGDISLFDEYELVSVSEVNVSMSVSVSEVNVSMSVSGDMGMCV